MFLKRPKEFGQALNSLKGLKYLAIVWFVIGTSPPNANEGTRKRLLYYLYTAFINLLCSIYFPATMLVNLFFINSYKELVANLSVNVSVFMSCIKQLPVLKHRQNLLRSHDYLKLLDERCNHHKQDRKHIFNAIYSSQLFSFCFPLFIFCGYGFGYNGWRNHRMIYNAWYPNIFRNAENNFLAAFIFQFICQQFTSLQSGFNDTYPLCYLTLMIGHLEALAGRIARIGWQEPRNSSCQENNIVELTDCIKDHKNLLRYFDCIRALISITLLFQFLIAGLALCLTAINLTFFNTEFNELFFNIMYLGILLIQMFPCCWYVNTVMEKSNYLTTAIYSCNWMDQNLKFRKMVIIFMQRSQKTNTILAGNLAPVTLQTFLSIIRFAFSMFTIFSKM